MEVEEFRNCKIPKELYYNLENQVWFKVEEDGSVRIGLTDVGQTKAGKIVNVRIKAVGRFVKKGKPYGSLESGKWAGPIPADVEGEVIERNEELFDRPELINEDPYGKGWILRIKPTNLERDLKGLVTGDEAVKEMKKIIEEEDIDCGSHSVAEVTKQFYR